MKQTYKKLFLIILIPAFTLTLTVGALNAWIDPYFHYHAPLKGFNYPIYNERYQNYGIAKNFEYNAIIAGTSMTENFKTSEFDRLFGVKSVKLPFSGGSHLEINDELKFAFDHHDNITCVIRGLDLFKAFDTKDSRDYPADSYPTFLYDDKLINDVHYLFNRSIFFKDTAEILIGASKADTFDTYANWNSFYPLGPSGIRNNYTRTAVVPTYNSDITEKEYEDIYGNITENVLKLAENHPETTFYIFISPYSIYFWDYVNELGEIDRFLKVERYLLSLLTGHENIRVFSFFGETETISDPYNYKDIGHYGEKVNSLILEWIKEGRDELTAETYEEYCDWEWDYFHSYDYDSLYEEDGVTIAEPASAK